MLLRIARGTTLATTLCALVALSACAHRERPQPSGATDPDAAAAALIRGERAYADERWTDAEDAFLAAARASETDAEPWFKLGNVYFRSGRYDLAAAAYEQCLRRAPGHAKAWHNLGVVRLHQADRSFEHVDSASQPPDTALTERAHRLREILGEAIAPAPDDP